MKRSHPAPEPNAPAPLETTADETPPDDENTFISTVRRTDDGTAEVRVSWSVWKGTRLAQIRWWRIGRDGTATPSGRGVALRPGDLPALREALAFAEGLFAETTTGGAS